MAVHDEEIARVRRGTGHAGKQNVSQWVFHEVFSGQELSVEDPDSGLSDFEPSEEPVGVDSVLRDRDGDSLLPRDVGADGDSGACRRGDVDRLSE